MCRIQKKKVTQNLSTCLEGDRSQRDVEETVIDFWLFFKVCLSWLLLTQRSGIRNVPMFNCWL